jgi:pseudouridine kinase
MQSVVCVGSALVDELYFCNERVITGTSNPAVVTKSVGGVLTNVAFHLSYLGVKVDYVTIVGDDSDGEWILNTLSKSGVTIDSVGKVNESTGKYVSFLNEDGSLHAAACVDICEKYLDENFLKEKIKKIEDADIIICDTNISKHTIKWLIEFAKKENKILIIEPVSVAKSKKLSNLDLNDVFMITPNEDELVSIMSSDVIDSNAIKCFIIEKGLRNIWLRKGSSGSAMINSLNQASVNAKKIKVIDSTGAGDAALAGWVAAYLNNFDTLKCIQIGHSLAFEVLQVKGSVKHDINFSELLELNNKHYPDE